MSLNLHESLRSRLVEAITEGLPRLLVDNGMFLQSSSKFLALYKADAALPDHGRLHDTLVRYVDEYPLIEFAGDVLASELLRKNKYNSDILSQKLIELPEYVEPFSVASRLVEKFDSLPWEYVFSLRLPESVAELLDQLIEVDQVLGSDVSIISSTSALNSQFPLNCSDLDWHNRIHSRSLIFPATSDVSWDDDDVVLQIRALGFVGPYGGSLSISVERKLKSFFGLCIALRLLKVKIDYSPLNVPLGFYLHINKSSKWEIDNRIELSTDTSYLIRCLRPSDMIEGADTESKKSISRKDCFE